MTRGKRGCRSLRQSTYWFCAVSPECLTHGDMQDRRRPFDMQGHSQTTNIIVKILEVPKNVMLRGTSH